MKTHRSGSKIKLYQALPNKAKTLGTQRTDGSKTNKATGHFLLEKRKTNKQHKAVN
jgi:hypothetical protein